jgi:Ca2+-transporting ATPase
VILTVFMALGAWRLSRMKALVRRTPVLETLGTATVLCTDKTGTLTHNTLEIKRLWTQGHLWDESDDELPELFHGLLEFGVLASQREPFDPMEKALADCLNRRLKDDLEHHHPKWTLMKEYPLSDELMAMSMVWQKEDHPESYVVASKGSPEAIMDLCHLPEDEMKIILSSVVDMASKGFRVIGIARALFETPGDNFPGHSHDFNFSFMGLIGFEDPIREDVPDAVMRCQNAGIRIMMLTGDYPETAHVIAKQMSLSDPQFISGASLDTSSNELLWEKMQGNVVFSRVLPRHKLRIIEILKDHGEIVAMTGDGVNDAPALKAADVGIAMGKRGTDVAREASDIVLTEDNFSSIVSAIELGRRIFDNLKKASGFVLAIHIPIAGLSLIPSLFRWPTLFFPIHIVFLELIIDPVCSVMFESEPIEKDAMQRPPRAPSDNLFTWSLLMHSVFEGVVILGVCLVTYLFSDSRAITFVTLIGLTLGLIVWSRGTRGSSLDRLRLKNPYQLPIFMIIIFALFLVFYIPFLRRLFHF